MFFFASTHYRQQGITFPRRLQR